MAPKKAKKDSKKVKKSTATTSTVVPVENKPIDSDWWDVFWQKNSSTPGTFLELSTDLVNSYWLI